MNTVLLLFLLAERSGSPGSASRLFEWAAASEEGNVESAAEDRATGSPPVGGRESVDLGEGDSEAASRGDSNQDSSGGSRDAEIESAGGADADEAAPEGFASSAPEAARSEIRLQILNSVGVRRLAASTAEALMRLGYDVRETGNARDRENATRVIGRTMDRAQALRVAEDLGLPSRRAETDLEHDLVDVDVTVILGADYRRLAPLGGR